MAYNNKAVELLINNPDSALLLLNKATEIDTTNYIAFNNKTSLYCSKGDYQNAIFSANQGIKAKPDLAESVTFLGMLYDYTGQFEKAKEQYQIAIEIYNQRITSAGKNEFANKLNRAHTILLLGDQKEGEREVQELLFENPDDSTIKMLIDFDKVKYLNEIFTKQE